MNEVSLQTFEIRILQVLLSNRITELDQFIAGNDYAGLHGIMAGSVRRADEAYRADLQAIYAKLDSANPI